MAEDQLNANFSSEEIVCHCDIRRVYGLCKKLMYDLGSDCIKCSSLTFYIIERKSNPHVYF